MFSSGRPQETLVCLWIQGGGRPTTWNERTKQTLSRHFFLSVQLGHSPEFQMEVWRGRSKRCDCVFHIHLLSIIRYLSLFSSLTLIMLYFHLSNAFLFLSIVLSFCFWFLGENEDYFFFIKSKILMDKSVFCTFITLTILLSDVLKSEVPFSTVLLQEEVSSLCF